MAISSTSTIDEVYAAYIDNALWDLHTFDAAKHAAWVHAARALLILVPKRTKITGPTSGSEIEIDPMIIRGELDHAIEVGLSSGSALVTVTSFRGFP